MQKIVTILVFGVALGAVAVINPDGLLAEDVVEENLAGEVTADQAAKPSAKERWDGREDRRDRSPGLPG